jgi:Major intrinsic protein
MPGKLADMIRPVGNGVRLLATPCAVGAAGDWCHTHGDDFRRRTHQWRPLQSGGNTGSVDPRCLYWGRSRIVRCCSGSWRGRRFASCSGGAFNPAVVVGGFLMGGLPAGTLWMYWLSQLVAGAVAAGVFRFLNPERPVPNVERARNRAAQTV